MGWWRVALPPLHSFIRVPPFPLSRHCNLEHLQQEAELCREQRQRGAARGGWAARSGEPAASPDDLEFEGDLGTPAPAGAGGGVGAGLGAQQQAALPRLAERPAARLAPQLQALQLALEGGDSGSGGGGGGGGGPPRSRLSLTPVSAGGGA